MVLRRTIAICLPLILCLPSLAMARVCDRCWLSVGLFGGPAVHTDTELKDEFNVTAHFELEVKHYLWKPFSLAGAFGFLYGEGRPKRLEWHDDWVELGGTGISLWHSYTFNLVGRVEIGRYWRFNPYLGGGIGGAYNNLWRKGPLKGRKISDSYSEWLLDYLALVGFDVMFNEFFAGMLEGRWTFMPSQNSFVDERDFGFWSGILGLRVYF